MKKTPTEKDFFLAVLKDLEHPLAPILLNELHEKLDRAGKLFASKAVLEDVLPLGEKMMSALSNDDAELNKISQSPAFIIALSAMLKQALVSYAASLIPKPKN